MFANCTYFSSHHEVSVLVGRGVGPQVNKFKQVSSDVHQISVAGGGRVSRSSIWGRVSKCDVRGEGTLPCDLSNDLDPLPPSPEENDRYLLKHYLPTTSLAGSNEKDSHSRSDKWRKESVCFVHQQLKKPGVRHMHSSSDTTQPPLCDIIHRENYWISTEVFLRLLLLKVVEKFEVILQPNYDKKNIYFCLHLGFVCVLCVCVCVLMWDSHSKLLRIFINKCHSASGHCLNCHRVSR